MVIPVGEGTGGQKSGGDGYNGRPKGVGFKRIVTFKIITVLSDGRTSIPVNVPTIQTKQIKRVELNCN
jgi:hypothetical protein